MRIAFFSDIHGNREALDATLAHAARRKVDRSVFLGDIVGYGADPSYVIERVRREIAAGAIALRGNHDEAAALGSADNMNDYARAAILWTCKALAPDERAFLRALPMSVEEDDRLYVHAEAAAPREWGYVTDKATAERSLRATSKRLTFCGHVHKPQLYTMGRSRAASCFTPQTATPIPLIGDRQWLAVVGAVGQPRDRNPAAAYAILDTGANELIFERAPYDVEAAAAKIHAAHLPQILAARLFIGR